MPYKIVEFTQIKSPERYKVKKNQPGQSVFFSNKFLSLSSAKKQLRALYAAENSK